MENNVNSSNAGQSMGIVAVVLGIIGVIAGFIPCFGFIAILFGVLAILFGAIGMSMAKKEQASTSMPKAGLILGIVATVFVFLWIFVIVGTIGSAAISHKDEIMDAIDSVKVETERMHEKQDSLNNAVEITADSVKVEETETVK